MLFVTTVRTPSSNYKAVTKRFKAGGAPPPVGIKMLGRWHRADGSGAVIVCETDDAVALAKWTREWADVLSIEVVPVLTDAEMGDVLS